MLELSVRLDHFDTPDIWRSGPPKIWVKEGFNKNTQRFTNNAVSYILIMNSKRQCVVLLRKVHVYNTFLAFFNRCLKRILYLSSGCFSSRLRWTLCRLCPSLSILVASAFRFLAFSKAASHSSNNVNNSFCQNCLINFSASWIYLP